MSIDCDDTEALNVYDFAERSRERKSKANGAARPITLIPFNEIEASTDREYLIHGIIPSEGLTVVWGAPKSFKSFWVHDMAMHIALGDDYRGRKIKQGAVIYCAFEGGSGFRKRCVAWRQKFLGKREELVLFYLQPMRLDLVNEAERLITSIRDQGVVPALVVLDTLNRSLVGNENNPDDMGAYIAVADKIREAFGCAVIIVHHCGLEATRPRGHTSLEGAVDAKVAVKRRDKTSTLTVEWMKDGEEGATLYSLIEVVEIGRTADGEPITSCVLVPAAEDTAAKQEQKMTPNQKTMYRMLHDAGRLKTDEWNDLAREAGIGERRRADLVDIRKALIDKRLIKMVGADEWGINHVTD
jgi:hypothetical protein